MLRSEYILERLEELYACLENFPESKLRPVWEHAIEELEEEAKIYC